METSSAPEPGTSHLREAVVENIHRKGAGARAWRVAVAALAVAVAGCDRGSEAILPGVVAPAAPSAGAEQEFARVLALALREPEARALVHGAMRGSRFNEHKLVLQTFLETRDGARLASAMAAAGGVDEGQVRGWAARLPAMDFYVPFVEHRRNWTGGADVVVGANMDVDQSKFTGYTPEGGRIAFDARAGTPRQAVIFLHPAEPKAIRPSAGPRTGGGRTIQDPSEPHGPLLNVTEVPDAGICDPNDSGCGGAAEAPPPNTRLGTFWSFKNYESDGVGGVEIVVKHYAGRYGPRIDQVGVDEDGHFTWDGFFYDQVTTVNRRMYFSAIGPTWIKVWERDSGEEGWFGGDDWWGEGEYNPLALRHRFSKSVLAQHIYERGLCSQTQSCPPNLTVDLSYVP
jgi:hypothetical protein